MKNLVGIAIIAVALIIVALGIKNLSPATQSPQSPLIASPQTPQAPHASRVPVYQLDCGDALGPDLRDLTNLKHAVFVIPPNCTSGIVFVPRGTRTLLLNPTEALVSTFCSSKPSAVAPPIPNGIDLNLNCVTVGDPGPGNSRHIDAPPPVAFKVRNPQSTSATIDAEFQ